MKKWNFLSLLLLAGLFSFSQNYPVAIDDYYTVNVGDTILISPLVNDYDPLGHELKIFKVDKYYTLGDTIINFIAQRSHVGEFVITYYASRVNDEFAYSNPATITINVIGEPWEPPVAGDDYIEVPVQGYAYINITDNDYSEDGYYIRSVSNAEKYQNLGFAEVTSSKHLEFYAFGSPGVDSTYYHIEGKYSGIQDTARIHFKVTEGQQQVYARDDDYEVLAGYPYTFEVLSNDTPTTANIVELRGETGKVNFSISENTIICKPDGNFHGTDSVRYIIEYDNKYDIGTIRVNVEENNDLPIANPDKFTVSKGVRTPIDLLNNDTYNDEIIEYEVPFPYDEKKFEIYNGTEMPEIAVYTYAEYPLFFKYRLINAENNLIHSEWVRVSISVDENASLPIANNDTVTWNLNSTEILTGFLENDTDPENYELQVNTMKLVLPGYTNRFLGDSDSLQIRSKFTDTVNLAGLFKLPYTVKRKTMPEVVSDTGYIYVNIIPFENLPVANPDTVFCTGIQPEMVNVLENDSYGDRTPVEVRFFGDYYHMIINNCEIINEGMNGIIYPALGYTGWTNYHYLVTFDDETQALSSINIHIDNRKQQTDVLNINKLTARFNSHGVNFTNYVTPFYNSSEAATYHEPEFLCENEDGIFPAMNESSIWITALSEDGYMHFSGNRYIVDYCRLSTTVDFQPGPISNNYDDNFKSKYVRIWKIDRGMIANHVNNYNNPGYEMPEEILTWPGNGNPVNGEAEQLAPYYDKNENGIYEPTTGEYPLIRGDLAIFFMINDDIEHTESLGMRMKTEIHAMAYAFENPEDETLDNTIFIHYDIYNRSDRNYHDAYVGIYGISIRDNQNKSSVGTDVQLTSNFFYNTIADGALATTYLGGPLLEADGVDNPNGGCDESVTGSGFGDGIADNERLGLMNSSFPELIPISGGFYPEDWKYQYSSSRNRIMRSIYYNNEPLMYGGDGYTSLNTTNLSHLPAYGPGCRYMYPWDTDPCNYGLDGETPNGPTDWRHNKKAPGPDALGTCGPFTFEAGGNEELDIAYVYAYDPEDNDDTPSVELLKARIADLLQKRDNGEIYPYFITETGQEEYSINYQKAIIYPSPATDQITIKAKLSDKAEYRIYNSTGTCLLSGTLMDGTLHPVKVNTLRPGIYILKIENETKMFTGKFVIGN